MLNSSKRASFYRETQRTCDSARGKSMHPVSRGLGQFGCQVPAVKTDCDCHSTSRSTGGIADFTEVAEARWTLQTEKKKIAKHPANEACRCHDSLLSAGRTEPIGCQAHGSVQLSRMTLQCQLRTELDVLSQAVKTTTISVPSKVSRGGSQILGLPPQGRHPLGQDGPAVPLGGGGHDR